MSFAVYVAIQWERTGYFAIETFTGSFCVNGRRHSSWPQAWNVTSSGISWVPAVRPRSTATGTVKAARVS